MLKNKKYILYITVILISVIIFISMVYILLNLFNIQKKQISSNLVQKSDNNPISTTLISDEIGIQYRNGSNWRIIIQKINVNAPILEGTSKEVLRRGVGHFETTSKWNGNICLAAHNQGYKYNYFQEIKSLEMGDIITYKTEKGTKNYEVIRNETIKETDLSCIEDSKENKITLITCEKNKRDYRRCVQAKEI